MRFDYIIIGAGSGGAVLAARLSENPQHNVLLLEAGPDHTAAATPSAISGPNFFDALEEPGRLWPTLMARRTADQPPVRYQRGRGVGGSSAVNAMVAIPGIPEDYDRWEQLGATGWNWRSLAPWFARTALSLNPAPHSERGPVSRALLEALPNQAAPALLTRDATGRRMSTNDCYLEPARTRANLQIRGGSMVDRVILRERRAVGVRLVDGTEFEADEVIVCCGAIHSPAVLLRSGIDTPGVGEGLKDHVAFRVTIELDDDIEWDPRCLPISVVGRLSSGESPGDLQVLAIDHLGESAPHTAMVMVALMEVRSTGSVTLADRYPMTDPTVEFDLLRNEVDVRRLLNGIGQLERLLEHPSMRRLGTALVGSTDLEHVSSNLGDYVHAAGTCAMGRVLDSRCGLIGYQGLRVCDASVMPDLPRANTHLTTVVLAERLASLL